MANLNSGRGIVDSAQILPYIYDMKEEAIRVLPAAGAGFSIELNADEDSVATRSKSIDTTILFENISAAENYNSLSVDILNYTGFSVMIAWENLDKTEGTIRLQGSLDGQIWDTIAGESRVLNKSGDAHLFNISGAHYKYFGLSYEANGNSSGTISAKYVIKG